MSIREVDSQIARKAALLREQLDPMDALIAATAIEENCDAIIGNDSAIASKLTEIPYLYLEEYIL